MINYKNGHEANSSNGEKHGTKQVLCDAKTGL
jgi:hypothetical protein